MITDEQQDSPKEQPEKPPKSSNPPVDSNADKIKKENTKPADPGEKNKPKCDSPQPFVVKVDKNKGWSRAEIISAFAAGLSFIAIVMMVMTFSKTRRAIQISEENQTDVRKKDSVAMVATIRRDSLDSINRETNRRKDSLTIDLAIQSLQSQKRYTDITDSTFRVTRKYAERSDSNYIKSIQIASTSLDVSKESLVSIQKNFERENRAIMFMSAFNFSEIKTGDTIKTNITFRNFGKSPALIIQFYINVGLDTVAILQENKFIYPKKNIDFINLFLPVDGTYTKPFNIMPLADQNIKLIKEGKQALFIFGELIYYDLIRKQNSKYQFCFRLYPNNTFSPTPNHNMILEVYEIKQR